MGLKQDLPILGGIALILTGVVFVVGSAGLPGIGSLDNPVEQIRSQPGEDADRYDVTTQINVGSTALGETSIDGFTYQTQPSRTFSLNIADNSALSIGGADNVKADVRVVSQDTGKVYVQTTKFLGDLGPGETREMNVNFDNVPPGTYLVRYIVTYDPEVFDLSDVDNVKRERVNIEVPKTGGAAQ